MKTGPTNIEPYLGIFGRYLREQGLPVTQQRIAVAKAVFSSSRHQSVEDLETVLRAKDFRLGKATIYRTLDLLVRSGMVEEHDFGEGLKRYEHRLSRDPVHHHLVCTESGEVIEFRSEELRRIVEETAARHGFRPTHHKLVIFGLSRASQESGADVPYRGITCPIETT
ncbi:MAG: Fur family transcriptional regulator [Gemmatimonadetes bacterium]|nr:Fur family transcriptional regulator [Gemmatimonadota bacterium]